MWTYLKDLWTDKAVFRAAIRSLIQVAGAAVTTGAIPLEGDGWKFGPFIMAMATLINAGQQNTEPAKPLQ